MTDTAWLRVIAIICIVGAAAIAMTGQDGWGWLVFLAFVSLTYD